MVSGQIHIPTALPLGKKSLDDFHICFVHLDIIKSFKHHVTYYAFRTTDLFCTVLCTHTYKGKYN
jgi:hypothetical protein